MGYQRRVHGENKKQLKQNGQESFRKGFHIPRSRPCCQEGCPQEKKNRDLLRLHLPCPQASAPRDRHLQEIHEHHELFHQRCLREDRFQELPPRQIQQEAHSLLPRGPGRRPPPPPR